jgi:hypothetical protein
MAFTRSKFVLACYGSRGDVEPWDRRRRAIAVAEVMACGAAVLVRWWNSLALGSLRSETALVAATLSWVHL